MMHKALTKQHLEELLRDPLLSDWLKEALAAALKRDPFEAALDAELLYSILNERAQAISDAVLGSD